MAGPSSSGGGDVTTVAKLVARSLRLLRVIDAVQPVKPQDMSTAIEALNGMLRRWEANGIALGWQPVDNPSDTLPLPEEAEEAVAYNLALTLQPEYTGGQPDLNVVAIARSGYALLQRDNAVANPLGWDRCVGGYNTYTDGPGYTRR